jgi:hypothetical protein
LGPSDGALWVGDPVVAGPEQAGVPEEEEVAVLEVGGMQLAFAPFRPTLFLGPPWWYRLPMWEDLPVPALGIGLPTLRSLAASVREGRELRTDQLEETEARVQEAHDGLVSVFSDTTAFGILPAGALWGAESVPV